MRFQTIALSVATLLAPGIATAQTASSDILQLGPRPFYLVEQMKDGPLKTRLRQCNGPYKRTDFSIGHRGAPLQFPEHTRESDQSRRAHGHVGLDCDVTFTQPRNSR